jgi:hypothetical protein
MVVPTRQTPKSTGNLNSTKRCCANFRIQRGKGRNTNQTERGTPSDS